MHASYPHETHYDNMQTLTQVIETVTDGIKLHPLHIVDCSTMTTAWRAGRLVPLTQQQYLFTVSEIIRHTPPEIIYHRISASTRKPTLLAPQWCENHWLAMNAIYQELLKNGGQGSVINRLFIPS